MKKSTNLDRITKRTLSSTKELTRVFFLKTSKERIRSFKRAFTTPRSAPPLGELTAHHTARSNVAASPYDPTARRYSRSDVPLSILRVQSTTSHPYHRSVPQTSPRYTHNHIIA